jgi:preprotein translocase subunit SecA
MFDELKSTIRQDVGHTIFRVTVTREPHQHQQPRRMTEGRLEMGAAAAAGGAAGGVSTSAAGGPVASATDGGGGNGAARRTGPKIGRNDPCWCGSGKKYKRCHGA